jgi:hypothetical protein
MLTLLWFVLAFLAPAWAAASCTVTPSTADGPKVYLVRIEETGSRDTTEVECTGLPRYGTLLWFQADLTAGTGTTIHSVWGWSAGFSTTGLGYIGGADATAAFINEMGRQSLYMPTGKLYVRNAPNSVATDHAISTLAVIQGAL